MKNLFFFINLRVLEIIKEKSMMTSSKKLNSNSKQLFKLLFAGKIMSQQTSYYIGQPLHRRSQSIASSFFNLPLSHKLLWEMHTDAGKSRVQKRWRKSWVQKRWSLCCRICTNIPVTKAKHWPISKATDRWTGIYIDGVDVSVDSIPCNKQLILHIL